MSCVFIEKLNGFLDCKSKALNRGSHAFRRAVHRIPCGELRSWITRKLTFGECHVELVPAAYTSKCGEAFWSDLFDSNHQAAALMIARRGLGLGLFRRVPARPPRSSVTEGECGSACLGDESPAAHGRQVRVGGDFGEPGVAPGAGNIPSRSTPKDLSLRTPRRTHRLSAPVGRVVPR